MQFLTCVVSVLLVASSNCDEKIPTGAVVTNGIACAKIGTSILDKGGNAIDAAIAALFCEGVSVPNCMGLGGGFLMNIYIKENKTNVFLNSREVAPISAAADMYGSDENLALRGGLAVAVPGELKGYWEAYNKYGGKVAWKELVQPTIDLCNKGILVTEYLEKLLASQKEVIFNDEFLRETFIDPDTNDTYVQNQTIKRPRLAKTLELVAESGPDVLYNGTLTEDFIKDIRDKKGIITDEDLENYAPQWKQPVKITLPFNQTLYASPLPGSGVVLGLIMNILSDYLDYTNPESVVNWQRIVESFKYGFAERTELGDPDFVNMTGIIAEFTSVEFAKDIRSKIYDNQTFQDPAYYGAAVTQPDDHGTANLCVLAHNGDAVVVTSTINTDFGAGFMSGSTGIILNDQMDDFSSPQFNNTYGVPPSPNNYIVPGKRPVSSMSPSIVVGDDGNVRLLIGGSGGTKIITSVALAMIRNLWFNYTIDDAVAGQRVHHQLFPMWVQVEKQDGNETEFLNALQEIGHEYEVVDLSDGFNTLTSISRENGSISASFDPRRGGSVQYVYNTSTISGFSVSRFILMLCFIVIIQL